MMVGMSMEVAWKNVHDRLVKFRERQGETKVKRKPAHKVDHSGHFEFGGTFGTAAMMLVFPILMYYLWVCSTFYGGSLQLKRGSETWLAFVDRIVAHITKVDSFQDKAYDRVHHRLSVLGYSTGYLLLLKGYSTSLSLVSK